MRRLFFSPAFPCRECEGDVTLLLFFDRGVIMWGLGCVTCAGYSGQAKVFGQTNHTQGLNPRPQCTRPTWLDLPLHILCCVQAYCSVKFTGKTSCIRNYVEFYCIWKQVSVSFFFKFLSLSVKRTTFWFRGTDSSAGVIWATMEFGTVKQALTVSGYNETGLAGGKLVHWAHPSLWAEEWKTERMMDARSGRCQVRGGKADLPVVAWTKVSEKHIVE